MSSRRLKRIAADLIKNQNSGLYPDQHSEEWHLARQELLTASVCATALDCNPYESSHELLVRKVASHSGIFSIRSNSNTAWGNKYEPIAKAFYENLFNVKVHDIGLVTHPIYDWLGASPDGLMTSGKLLEIKCPVHRKIGDIPHYYWIQVQIQLEVCNLDECDFLECEFNECTKEQYELISDKTMKGIIQPIIPERSSPKNMNIMPAVDSPVTYWQLKKYSIHTIRRNQDWLKNNINYLKIFWDKVIYYKEKGQRQLFEDTKKFSSLVKSENVSEKKSIPSVGIQSRRSKRKANVFQKDPDTILPTRNLRSNKRRKLIRPESIRLQSSNTQTGELIDWKKWISATKTRNYMIEDPLLDWLEYHGNHNMFLNQIDKEDIAYPMNFNPGESQTPMFGSNNIDTLRANYDVGEQFESDYRSSMLFTNFLKENGTKFEKYVMKELFNKFPDDIVIIADQYQARSVRKFQETIDAMNNGTPIIYHGVLHNHINRTYGVADLIVRSDWLNKIFSDPVISESSEKEKARSLKFPEGKSWHYRIVEIKFTTLGLRADGKHILKNNSVEAMKSQLWIYNMALGIIQGYRPTKAYIIGRKWQYKKCGVIHSGEGWFDKVGHVNFKTTDRHIRKKTRDALRWIHKVRRHGHNFTLNPPSCKELYPNMCNQLDGPWRRIKQKIADEIHEITSLWQCGPKNREAAHAHGILGWQDPKCCSELLGVTGLHVPSTLQQIIDVNLTSELDYLLGTINGETTADSENLNEICELIRNDTQIIIPDKIDSNKSLIKRWFAPKNKNNKKKTTLFVDFETLLDLTQSEDFQGSSYIFMIGAGYEDIDSGKWTYKCFYTNKVTSLEEREMFISFHKFLSEFSEQSKQKTIYPDLLHWSHAEKTFYNNAWNRHGNNVLEAGYTKIDTWKDMLKVFKNEPITIRGALNFSLKSIAKAFHKHGLIETTWPESPCADGLSAMILANNCYRDVENETVTLGRTKDIMAMPTMRDIRTYNEVDCKVLYEILRYLVKYRT